MGKGETPPGCKFSPSSCLSPTPREALAIVAVAEPQGFPSEPPPPQVPNSIHPAGAGCLGWALQVGDKPTQRDPRCPEATGFSEDHLGLTMADGLSLSRCRPPPAREEPGKPAPQVPPWLLRLSPSRAAGSIPASTTAPRCRLIFHHVYVFLGDLLPCSPTVWDLCDPQAPCEEMVFGSLVGFLFFFGMFFFSLGCFFLIPLGWQLTSPLPALGSHHNSPPKTSAVTR